MARFGTDKAKSFDSIHGMVNEIMISANFWADMRIECQQSGDSNKDSQWAQIKELQKIIWYSGKDDKTNAQVEEIIKNIENVCKPIITNAYSSKYTNIKNYLKISVNSVFSVAKKIRSKMWKKK